MTTHESSPVIQEQRPAADRGGCLTTWLVFMIVANVILIFVNLANLSQASFLVTHGVDTGPAVWGFIVDILLDIIILVGAIALFSWMRWGFYLIGGCFIIGIFVDIFAGAPVTFILLDLGAKAIGLAILRWVLWRENRWGKFFH